MRCRNLQGRLLGCMDGSGFQLRTESSLTAPTSDALKSSVIEGGLLDPEQVRSSLARQLGLDLAGLKPESRDVDRMVEKMMLDATQFFQLPLTTERLMGRHPAPCPTGRSGMARGKTLGRVSIAPRRQPTISPSRAHPPE
jgi:hypothetical protein